MTVILTTVAMGDITSITSMAGLDSTTSMAGLDSTTLVAITSDSPSSISFYISPTAGD
jgi:hypothetical protein